MIKRKKLNCIDQWKRIILSGDTSNLNEIIHDKAIFYSPVVFTPQQGKKKVLRYLSAAVKVFQTRNFRYIRSISNENYTYAEFEAKFEDIIVNGIDLIIINNNLIYEFKVYLRPLKGLQVVWDEMKTSLQQ